ncbi:MAG: MucR family transcriptional regulator, partial [Mesorhizobium sp.]
MTDEIQNTATALMELTADIVAAYVSKNSVPVSS